MLYHETSSFFFHISAVPSNSDEKQEVNKEVTNYQTIEVDGHSKIDEESPAGKQTMSFLVESLKSLC